MKNDNRIKCGPKSIPAIRVIRLKSNNGASFSTTVCSDRTYFVEIENLLLKSL